MSCETVKKMYESFAQGDVDAVLAALDSRVQWWEAEGFLYAAGNPYVGPQAVADGVFRRLAEDIEDFTVTPTTFIDAGETVVVEGRYGGTLKAAHASVDAQFAHIWTLDAGKVIRFQQYTDTGQWSRLVHG